MGKKDERPTPQYEPESLVSSYIKLDQVHTAFDVATWVLEQARGAPVCIPSCGWCCEHMTPLAYEVEAYNLVSTLAGVGASRLAGAVKRAEGWLVERHPQCKTYGWLPGRVEGERWQRLQAEVGALTSVPCPFLDDDKTCLIWGARPLMCRAYGVTQVPSRECRRPYGIGEHPTLGETPESRSVYGGRGTQVIEGLIGTMLRHLPLPGLRMTGFLPTQLYRVVEPDKLRGLVDSGRVASAKLVSLPVFHGILRQEELDAIIRGAQRQEALKK